MIYTSYYNSPIGKILLASKNKKLIGLFIEEQKYYFGKYYEKTERKDDDETILKTKKWLDKYFNGKKVSPKTLPLAPLGSSFQQKVWKILCEVPYGKTTTYKKIALEIEKTTNQKTPMYQAVGGAVSRNPISIIIPCHRVVGTNGDLTGYAAGLEKKIALLKIEQVDMKNFYMKGEKHNGTL